MKVLIIGSGGREHAIARQLSLSPQRPELFFAPGNPGMESLGQRLDIAVDDLTGLRLFAEKEQIDLTVVGPELPLSLGIVDQFQQAGLLIFGPNQKAAQLEASKAFSKDIMQRYGIPTAGYEFCLARPEAEAALSKFQPPYVIKEDGLAAGKGVTIAQNLAEANAALDRAFAKAMPVVIEEFLKGVELSVLAVCDGQRALPLISAQDFKRAYDGNEGPNTGGMGAYAPVPLATPAVMQRVQTQVLDPMMSALKQESIEYRGILYAGLMIDEQLKPSVVEFNVRFGDPETQVVVPLLQDDLLGVLLASAKGDCSAYVERGIQFQNQCAVTVVLASGGYPGEFSKGHPISLPNLASLPKQQILFHAGTKKQPDQQIVIAGGRVLNATGLGKTLSDARDQAYALAEQATFETCRYRRDIAEKPSQVPVFNV